MKKTVIVVTSLLYVFFFVNILYAAAEPGMRKTVSAKTVTSAGDEQALKASYLKLPLSFVKNEGQKDKSILYYEQGSGHATAFTGKGIVHSLGSGKDNIITLAPVNASPYTVEALERREGKVNYFIG